MASVALPFMASVALPFNLPAIQHFLLWRFQAWLLASHHHRALLLKTFVQKPSSISAKML